MARMIRKQVYIEPDQDSRLKQRASALGMTESELIRRGIDLATLQPGQSVEDEAEWQRELDFMRERARLSVPRQKRAWTREELYDERPRYLSR